MVKALRVGDRVQLTGLAARPELNGRHGKALRFVGESGRWKVLLDGESADSSLALKTENLRALPKYGDALARTVLLARARSGEGGACVPFLRTLHVLGATQWELGLQYAALAEAGAVRVGDRVRLVGLGARPELNGSTGTAVRFVAEKRRWKVLLQPPPPEGGGGSLVVKPENLQVVPVYREVGFEGPWMQETGRHVIRGTTVYSPDGEMEETIEVLSPSSFKMVLDGETLTATLEPDGRQLTWSDGDTWTRPVDEDALVHVVLVGPDLPEGACPGGELRRVPDWPEPGISVACFRGAYEDYVKSPAFTAAEITILSNPGLCASGTGGGFFNWAPALHALAAAETETLCVSTGVEPYGEGEWLGDALYDETVLKACGFKLFAAAARNPHSCLAKEHPSCGWHLWAYTIGFGWPSGGNAPEPPDDWMWKAYYHARRSRCELPRFRFRPPAPDLKPNKLIDMERKLFGDGADADRGGEDPAAGQESGKATKGNDGGSTRIVDESDDEERPEATPAGAGAEKEPPKKSISDEEEDAYIAKMEWVGRTVQVAWERGGDQLPVAAAAAAATAAAEEFADRSRANPLPPGHEHVIAVGACELAARVGASAAGGGRAVAVAAAGVVAVFEVLAYEALWQRHGMLSTETVGHIVLGGLASAERAGVQLEPGVASAVGQHASDAYERLSGRNQPPLPNCIEEFTKLAGSICDSAGAAGSNERRVISQAIVDNLDLAIPARGGKEASLRISMKMNDAPQCHRIVERP